VAGRTASSLRRMRRAAAATEVLDHRLDLPGRAPARRVTVLGDSAAAGHGIGSADDALPRRLGRALHADGTAVEVRCLAADGAATRDVLEQQLPELEPTDVVVVGVGVNDALRRQPTVHGAPPDGDVFALTGLPEVVKGALFARYSRSAESLKRLFLDEFADDLATEDPAARAEQLYDRVFSEYGDDSVAQLGGAHVALEDVSNLLTKRIEWGRLAAYLEQSTRYIPYDTKPDGRYRYHRDADIMAGPHAEAYERQLDASSTSTPSWSRGARLGPARWPQDEATSRSSTATPPRPRRSTCCAGCCPPRPPPTSGCSPPGSPTRAAAAAARRRARRVPRVADRLLPSCARHPLVPDPGRPPRPGGGAWSDYLAGPATRPARWPASWSRRPVQPAELVTLTDWSPRDPVDAEVALVTAALYPHVTMPEPSSPPRCAWSAERRAEVLRAYVGERANRRTSRAGGSSGSGTASTCSATTAGSATCSATGCSPSSGRTSPPAHGYETPPELEEAGVADRWHEALERSAALYERLRPTTRSRPSTRSASPTGSGT
jgi:lysophospholipase L1-like esterase